MQIDDFKAKNKGKHAWEICIWGYVNIYIYLYMYVYSSVVKGENVNGNSPTLYL